MEENKEIYQITIETNEAICKKRFHREDYSPFSMVGVLRNMENIDKVGFDIFDQLTKVSKNALNVFNELKLCRNTDTNICWYPMGGKTESEKVMFRRAMGELYSVGLVCKAKTVDVTKPLKKSSYMINPNYIKCWKDKEAKRMWNFYTKGE